jgi:type I restriction enzyme, S subunit
MTEWKEVTLENITTRIGDGLHGTPKYDSDGDYYFINGNNLIDGKILIKPDTKKVSKEVAKNNKKPLSDNTILLAINGTIGNLAFYKSEKCMLGKSACYINMTDEVDVKFMYYHFLNEDFQFYLEMIATGTTIPNVPLKGIRKYTFNIPPLPEQRAIASALSGLDDKIDLLHRQNKTLEQMAETLFRQWFIEEAQEDWEEVQILELFEVRDGTHDSPKKKNYGKKLITSKHLKPNFIDFQNAYYISQDDYELVNKRSKVERKDILFSMIGTIGNIYIEESDNIDYAIKNIGLFKTSQNIDWSYFTYLWLKSELGQKFIHENRGGSTQEYLSLGSLRDITFIIPSKDIVINFNNIVKDYFFKIKHNQTQIRTLEQLRDTLLPKLMRGEITVEIDG